MVSLVHSRLDYGNFVLVGLPTYQQRHLESVLNATARLVLCRYDHITDAHATMHWLHLPKRVDFKVVVMAFLVLHGIAPPYLSQLVRVADLVVADFDHRRHSYSMFRLSVGLLSHGARFLLQHPFSGTRQSSPSLPISVNGSRHFFSANLSSTF